MGQPAARITDMHTCPMVTPGLPPVPHVGGPITGPGIPTVLIGKMPAATMGDMCTCVGPPSTIIKGSVCVLIGGKPAARMGDNTAHGGVIAKGEPTVMIGDAGAPAAAALSTSALVALSKLLSWAMGIISESPLANPKVQELILKSPTLAQNLSTLTQNGWTIKYGSAGGGSFANREKKEIVIDPNENGVSITQTLAHETGHALYTPDPYVPHDGLTRDEYVSANVNSNLKDEGEATLMNAQVRDEINSNGGDDIGIAGKQSGQYENAYNSYETHGDRERARQEIGDTFADGENPSNDTGKTYREYYSKTYEDHYDKYGSPTP